MERRQVCIIFTPHPEGGIGGIGNTFSRARPWDPPNVAVMIAQVPGGPTTAVLMLNVPMLALISWGAASVTVAGTVTEGLLLMSWTTCPGAVLGVTMTLPESDSPPKTEFLDSVTLTGPVELGG
jgi:hypothetical protein